MTDTRPAIACAAVINETTEYIHMHYEPGCNHLDFARHAMRESNRFNSCVKIECPHEDNAKKLMDGFWWLSDLVDAVEHESEQYIQMWGEDGIIGEWSVDIYYSSNHKKAEEHVDPIDTISSLLE